MDISKRNRLLFIGLVVISSITAILMLITFNYWDGQSLMVWSVNNWDVLVEGRMRDFYLDKALNVRGAVHTECQCNFFMIFPLMIWDFPLWVTHYFNGNLNVVTPACIYWYKLLLLVVTIWIGIIVYKFVHEQTQSVVKSCISFLIVFASAEIMLSTMYTGQDEVIYMACMLSAIYALIHGKKKQFMIWSTCAVTLCPIMLLVFVVVLLVYEKKIWRVLTGAVITYLPTVIWDVYTRGAECKDYMTVDGGAFIQELMDMVEIPGTTGQISVTFVVLLIMCVYIYFQKIDEADKAHYTVWYAAVITCLICFFMKNHFYRLLVYVPFVVILFMGYEERNNRLTLFLMMIINYVRIYLSGFNSPQTLNTTYVIQTDWMHNLCNSLGSHKYEVYNCLTSKLIENMPILEDMGGVLNGTAIFAIGYILFLCHPKQKKEYSFPVPEWVSVVGYSVCMPLLMCIFYALLFHA